MRQPSWLIVLVLSLGLDEGIAEEESDPRLVGQTFLSWLVGQTFLAAILARSTPSPPEPGSPAEHLVEPGRSIVPDPARQDLAERFGLMLSEPKFLERR